MSAFLMLFRVEPLCLSFVARVRNWELETNLLIANTEKMIEFHSATRTITPSFLVMV